MTDTVVTQQVTWVTQEVTFRSVISWTASDPLAVTLAFEDQEANSWRFGYELLADVVEGRHNSAGECDVRIRRIYPYIILQLISPAGTATLTTDSLGPCIFVKAVNKAMALAEDYDIDAALAKLLGDILD